MTPERFSTLLQTYGADLRRWPEAERSAASRLAAHDRPELRQRSSEAALLDRWLDDYAVAAPDDALARRIVSAANAAGPHKVASTTSIRPWWRGQGLWPRAGFALTGLAGAVTGALVVAVAPDDIAPTAAAGWQERGTAFSEQAAIWSDE